MRMRSYTALLVAVCLLAAGVVHAQEFRATVKGQVTDQSRAAVPGATVMVQNQDTGETATAVSNADGAYTIPFLRPGAYTLTVDLTGFQKYARKDMRLEVGQTALVNVQLAVGGLTVTVTAPQERIGAGLR